MDRYRLDVKPSSYYLDLLREETIKVLPCRKAGYYTTVDGEFVASDSDDPGWKVWLQEEQERAVCKIGQGEMAFNIYLPVENSRVTPECVEIAKGILAQIAEMDSEARAAPRDGDEDDYEEQLGYLVITRDEVELHYFATTMNTEWGAYFRRHADGSWKFENLG